MIFYTPLIPLVISFLFGYLGMCIFRPFTKSFNEMQQNLVVIGCTGLIALVVLIITPVIVRTYFVRGFKGFGLVPRTIAKDVVGAITKLLAIWPLVLGVLLATTWIGKLLIGPDFEISKHEELEMLTKYPQWWSKLIIVVFAVVVAPLYEEILFRGHIQTELRNLTHAPWPAIVVSSIFFASMHPDNPAQWPALFVLAIGLGYAYEKSGSLFQSIFMHAMFNGTMTAATLLQQ
jgi:membrane protease YdiL (CAAX protease family)